jgi:putative ABC transport system ATP-binding protein
MGTPLVVAPAVQAPGTGPVVVRGRELVKRYGEGSTAVEALRDVSVDFVAGSFTAIMGPSGSGKSTLMHVLAGLDRPSAGWVEIDGMRLEGLSDHELTLLRRRAIGFIFQSFNLLPVLSAEENIALPVRLGGGELDRDWMESLIETVRLGDRREHRPSELSGNLDSTSGREVLSLLRQTVDTLGQTIVMVSHDASAAAIADRVLFLADGRIVDCHERPSVTEILDHIKALQR